MSALDLRPRNNALGDHQLDETRQPLFVVAHPQGLGPRNQLALVSGGINVPFSPGPHGPDQCEYACFPTPMEDRLVLLRLDGTHAVHATEIMNAIHGLFPGRLPCTTPTPIIESRVTSEASCSSVRFSVPIGRSGNTR